MKQFKIQSAPTLEKKDFISWNQDGHTIWAKIQTKEDFAHDPFNAHDDSDVGTIRVAKELEIHDHAAPVFHAPLETSEE